jgi:hypothetical protein
MTINEHNICFASESAGSGKPTESCTENYDAWLGAGF